MSAERENQPKSWLVAYCRTKVTYSFLARDSLGVGLRPLGLLVLSITSGKSVFKIFSVSSKKDVVSLIPSNFSKGAKLEVLML